MLNFAVLLCLAGIGLLGRPWPGGPFWLLPAVVLVVAVVAWLCVEFPVRRLTGGRGDGRAEAGSPSGRSGTGDGGRP